MFSNKKKSTLEYRTFLFKTFADPAAAWRFDHCSTHNCNGFFSLREVARGRAMNESKTV